MHGRPRTYENILDEALEVYKKTIRPTRPELMEDASSQAPIVCNSQTGNSRIEEGRALARLFRLCERTRKTKPGPILTTAQAVLRDWHRLGWAVMENLAHAASMSRYQRHFPAILNGSNRQHTWDQNKIAGDEARTQFRKLRRSVKDWAVKHEVIAED